MPIVSYGFFAQNDVTQTSGSNLDLSGSGLSLAPSPDVVALPDGGFLVVYSYLKAGPSGNTRDGAIRMQRMDSNGTKVGPEILVTPDGVGQQLNPAIAVLSDGRIGVVWLNGAATANVQLQVFSADMVALGPPATISFAGALTAPLSFGGSDIDVVGTPDGQFVVTATGLGQVYRSRFDPATNSSQILDTWNGPNVSFNRPAVTVLRDGRIITTASNNFLTRGSEVLTFENGAVVGNSINGSINDFQKIIPLADGGYAIAWRDSRYGTSDDISFRLYSEDGMARTGIINANAGFTIGSQDNLGIAQLANGFLSVTWNTGSIIVGAVFDVAGNRIGAPVEVGIGGVQTPEVVTLGDGSLAFVWNSGTGVQSRVVDFVRESRGDAQNEVLAGDGLRDLILGAAGNDTLRGFNGDDLLAGELGDDRLEGGDGNDLLNGGSGLDVLDGGNGNDTASYSTALEGVSAHLSFASGNTGEALGDTFTSIENLFGSNFNDAMRGDGNDNLIDGSEGNDVLGGAVGNDTLIGGFGADTLNGEAGFDTLSYQLANAGVTVFLGGNQFNTGQAQGDVYSSMEALVGSAFADVVGGDDGANDVKGFGGNDWIYGGGASDTLWGGEGSDILSGGLDQDRLDGGTGIDVAYYRDATSGVSAGLGRGGFGGEAFGDSFFNLENIWGSNFNDELQGDNNAGQVYGFAGDDSLSGLDGDDFFYGGTGADTITGGAGVDSAFFLSWNDHVNQFGTPEPYEGGDTFTDFVSGTDRIILSRYWFGFGNIGGPSAALTETHSNFVTNSNVGTGRPSLIWNNTNRTLLFDADGNGATQAVLLGTFQGNGQLALGDIWTA